MSTLAASGRRLRAAGRSILLVLLGAGCAAPPAAALSAPLDGAALPTLPMAFEPNRGQTDARVLYLARGRGYALFVGREEAVLALSGGGESAETVLRLAFDGGRPARGAAALEPLPGVSNYLSLDGSTAPLTAVPHFRRVRLEQVYPGVDVDYYGNGGQLEYDLRLAPGADPAVVGLRFGGADELRVDQRGDLRLRAGAAELAFQAPVAYQDLGGKRLAVECRYTLAGGRVGFEVGEYRRDLPLVIDPVFLYSSYFGGAGEDRIYDLAINGTGEMYVTGSTRSTNFPALNALQGTLNGGQDAFLSKLNAGGTALVFSTYLGADGDQAGDALALDGSGNIYLVGASTRFDPCYDMFEAKLNPTASAIVYSHTIQANGCDFAVDVAVNGAGTAFLVGTTSSSNFPMVNAVTATYAGGDKGFLRKVDAAGTVLVSTYLGTNPENVYVRAIALDPGGNVLVAGTDQHFDVDGDCFVTKVNNAINAVSWVARWGGADMEGAADLVVDSGGNAYVTGFTYSSNFTTANALQPTLGGDADAFLTKLSSAGAILVSTFLGGPWYEDAGAIARDGAGNVYLTGTDFSFDHSNGEAMFRKVDAALTAVLDAGSFGGTLYALGEAVAIDPAGNPWVAGREWGAFPMVGNGYQTSDPGDQNGFLVKLSATQPGLSLNDRTAFEGNGGTQTVTFSISLAAPPAGHVTVDYTTTDGTATAGADYVATSGTLTFAPGQTARFVNVTILGDTLDEADETFTLDFSNASGAALADPQGACTITDDDAAPSLSIADATVVEGGGATLAVTLSAASGRTVSVAWSTANGSAVSPGDYAAGSGTLSFAAGETTKPITRSTVDDALDEDNETFTVNLATPVNVTIADAQGVATLQDNDNPPALSIDDVTVTEGNAGTVNATFTVTLAVASGKTVGVSWATANGTATQPGDYTAGSGALSFTAGQTSRTVTVAVQGDTVDEPNETFAVNLGAPTNATLADGQGIGTITDDDDLPPGTLQLAAAAVSVAEGAGSVTLSVTRTGGTNGAVSVAYATANGSATQPADYSARSGTLSWANGDAAAKTVVVPIVDDALAEASETFSLTISGPTGGATLGSPTSTVVTILDNEAMIFRDGFESGSAAAWSSGFHAAAPDTSPR